MDKAEMNIQTLKLAELNPAEYNPRIISKDEFEGLKTSLKTFGQLENLVANKDMTLIGGHQRLRAMQALGWQEAVVAVVDVDKHIEQKLNVLLNSQAISGKFDDLKLAEVLEKLKLDDDYEALRLDKLEPLDLSEEDIGLYTSKIEPPIYEPESDTQPPIADLFNTKKVDSLIDDIDNSKIDDDIKNFLRAAAGRHCVFNYEQIAEYYAHSSQEVKDLMKASALIVIDFKRAIEDGYIKLSKDVLDLQGTEYE